MSDTKNTIAARAAQELKDGQVINLGIGIPTLVANHVPAGVDVVIHSENGAVGVGPTPEPHCDDPDRGNAGGAPVTLLAGGSYFDSATSFSMIRGGHIDATFLGTMQVDGDGNIASYESRQAGGRHGWRHGSAGRGQDGHRGDRHCSRMEPASWSRSVRIP